MTSSHASNAVGASNAMLRARPLRRLAIAVLLLALPSVAYAAEGTLLHEDTIYRVENLGTDDAVFVPIAVLDQSEADAAALVGDEWIAAVDDGTPTQRLARYDAETGTLLSDQPLVLPPGMSGLRALEAAPDGVLWAFGFIGVETAIGVVDPNTGVFSQRSTTSELIGGLTFHDGAALTLIESDVPEGPTVLASIDLSTGVVEPLVELDGVTCSPAGDLDVDRGVLHIAVYSTLCGIILPTVETYLVSFPFDLDDPDGVLEALASAGPGTTGPSAALVVRGTPTVVDVPTLSTVSMALLIGLLALAGGLLARRARPT